MLPVGWTDRLVKVTNPLAVLEKDALAGLFQVSALHNIVRLLFGAAGLRQAETATGARTFLLYGGGVIYPVLFVCGLGVPQNSAGSFVPLNGFDNRLHLLLGVGVVALALFLTRGRGQGRR